MFPQPPPSTSTKGILGNYDFLNTPCKRISICFNAILAIYCGATLPPPESPQTWLGSIERRCALAPWRKEVQTSTEVSFKTLLVSVVCCLGRVTLMCSGWLLIVSVWLWKINYISSDLSCWDAWSDTRWTWMFFFSEDKSWFFSVILDPQICRFSFKFWGNFFWFLD